ncbi:MAG: 50S ribosomal protein L18 [bacterium]|nr:50S ribosomal protein L18 [bacterium]
MKHQKIKNEQKARRHARNRAKILGTAEKPRLSIFCSNKFTNAQLIDDMHSTTLVAGSTHELQSKGKKTKVERARELGEIIAEKANKAGISKAVLSKGAYAYHGRVQAVAEGARAKGLVL